VRRYGVARFFCGDDAQLPVPWWHGISITCMQRGGVITADGAVPGLSPALPLDHAFERSLAVASVIRCLFIAGGMEIMDH
jgi:hypothetical protein